MLLKNTNSGMGSRRIFKPVEGEIEALQLLEGFYLSLLLSGVVFLGACGSKREEWSYFRATSDQSARSVSSLAIDCLRSPSPSCFFHQRFVNWHVKGRTKRNHPGWSRRGTSGISQAPHQNWLAESPVGKPRRTGYMLISFYHRRMALKEGSRHFSPLKSPLRIRQGDFL
jgi:hypothetical protein